MHFSLNKIAVIGVQSIAFIVNFYTLIV
jgi:hypothetical protein